MIDPLIKSFIDTIGKNLVFLDIVSVERKKMAKYNVSFYANKKKIVKDYAKNINEHIIAGNKSLLFLKCENKDSDINSSRHLYFRHINTSKLEEEKGLKLDLNSQYQPEYYLQDKGEEIKKTNEVVQVNNWKESVLSKLPIKSAIFFKVEFTISDKKFVSAVWLGFKDPAGLGEKKDIPPIIKRLIESFISSYSITKIANDLIVKLKQNSIKSSLANIVARGLSHTDSSHSMIYFEKDFIQKIKLSKSDEKRNILIADFEKYNDHLRAVMELIADITGGLGNQSSYLYNFKDVTKQIQENLFPSVEDAENFIYQIEPNQYIPQLSKNIVDNSKTCAINYTNIDKTILIPGGENGVTAFVQILKNIFRNILKHNLTQVDGDIIRLTININTHCDDKNLDNDFYQLEIIEDIETEGEKFNILKQNVDSEFLLEDNEIDKNAWGIKEIKISAAYLIGLKIENTKDENYFHNYNKPKKWYSVSRNNKSLVHTMFLKKSKFCNFISSKELNYSSNKIKRLNEKGIFIEHLIINNLSKINKDFEYLVIDNLDHGNYNYKSRNFKILYGVDISNNVEEIITFLEYSEKVNSLWFHKKYNVALKDYLDKQTHLFDESHKTELFELSNLERSKKKIKNTVWENQNYYEALIDNNNISDFEKAICIKTSVAILDERLQQHFYKTPDDHIHRIIFDDKSEKEFFKSDTLEKKKIFIPDIYKDNLYEIFYGENEEGAKRENTDVALNRIIMLLNYYYFEKDCEYIIIHFSGLEVISNEVSNKKLEEIETDLLSKGFNKNIIAKSSKVDLVYSYIIKVILELPGSGKYLILSSGKGTPTTLPNHCYFLSLNNIQILLSGKHKTKLDLVKALQSIRQIEN